MKYIFILFMVTFSSCNSYSNKPEELSLSEDFQIITIEDKYSLKIPNYMIPASELNKDASLQYKNDRKQAYAIVIDANKDDFEYGYQEMGIYNDSASVLQNYSEVVIAGMKEAEPHLELNAKHEATINDMKAFLYLFEGQPKGVPYKISYILAFAEGKERVYTLSCWTTSKRINKYKNTFFQIIQSLKEIENAAA